MIQSFPKEEGKIQENMKEKQNLLNEKVRSNDFEITKDNTMVSTTCATKIGEISEKNYLKMILI